MPQALFLSEQFSLRWRSGDRPETQRPLPGTSVTCRDALNTASAGMRGSGRTDLQFEQSHWCVGRTLQGLMITCRLG